VPALRTPRSSVSKSTNDAAALFAERFIQLSQLVNTTDPAKKRDLENPAAFVPAQQDLECITIVAVELSAEIS
jgi:hypothetical protein